MSTVPIAHVDLHAHYAGVRARIGGQKALAVLQIGAERTEVAVGSGAEASAVLALPIGAERTAREGFKQLPPGRLEFERTIEPVEDEVTRVKQDLPADAQLYSRDPGLREIARMAGVPESAAMTLDIEAMERVFSRLAAVIQGKPAAHEGIPLDNAFAARLLILREFMHHLHFDALLVLD